MSTETIFRLAFWVLLAGVFVMRIFFTIQVRRAGERVMPDHRAIERERRGLFVVRVILGIALFAWLILYSSNPPWMKILSVPVPTWLRWTGFVLGIASLLFWTWTHIAIGKEWSPQLQLREEHHIVTTGPYSRIRHPLYSAMMGYAISLVLVTANWFFIFFSAAAIVGTISRIPREEKMMIEGFGEEYQAYMQRTGRFFPKL
jgi:protein-S-isoprenylcysteine O-methyltransferase Ste14